MPEALGRSVYLSEFHGIPANAAGIPVFLSLHRQEEMDAQWKTKIMDLCHQLNEHGCRILADISKKTFAAMEVSDARELKEKLQLWAVRPDYGFTVEEIREMAEYMPVVLNASTVTDEELQKLSGCKELMAMHNFYPRPETALDAEYLKERTKTLQEHGLKVIAFIPGTGEKRGPLYEGLPTLEDHRYISPYAAYLDLVIRYGIDMVYVGDPDLDEAEERRIARYIEEGIIELPCDMRKGYEYLYGQAFTNRIDSPKTMIRAAESREYSVSNGSEVKPENTVKRSKGSITMDNEKYLRYQGEIMIAVQDFEADERVNVIGNVKEEYLLVTKLIERGAKFAFTE